MMEILYVQIIVGLVLLSAGVVAMIWRVNMMVNHPEKYRKYRELEKELEADIRDNLRRQGEVVGKVVKGVAKGIWKK